MVATEYILGLKVCISTEGMQWESRDVFFFFRFILADVWDFLTMIATELLFARSYSCGLQR